MKGNNAWVFGILFLAGFLYLAWNNFVLPFINVGETKITNGKIIDIKIGSGIAGQGFVQNVKYAYKVDDKYFEGIKTVDNKYGYQNIGNRVQIEYSIKTPSKNNVIKFYKDFLGKSEERFYSNKQNGYDQIELINRMFYYTEYADGGKIITKTVGEYKENSDTLFVQPYSFDININKDKELRFLVFSDSIKKIGLIDLLKDRKFLKLDK